MMRCASLRAVALGTILVCCALTPGAFGPSPGQASDERGGPLRLTPVEFIGANVRARVHTMIRWNGDEHPAAEGIRILMGVILDPQTHSALRAKALDALAKHGKSLHATDRIPALVSLYDTLRAREEKAALLFCLAMSYDPRGLPLFVKVLDDEEDNILRLAAGHGLAKWNVRRGGTELINLLACAEALNTRTVGDAAAILFRKFNSRKLWGCPEEEIRKSVEQSSIRDPKERTALYVRKIKEWFAENEERFPVWNLGDPLPPMPSVEKEASGGKNP